MLVLVEHHRVGGELLAEGHRHRVLQLRAADFQHAFKLDGFLVKGRSQAAHFGSQALDAELQRELDRGRVDVVGALRQVDVIERMQVLVLAARVAEQLERAVADHLVGVHVGRGASAALDHVDHELPVKLALAEFLAGEPDCRRALVVEQAELGVGNGRRLLYAGQRHE